MIFSPHAVANSFLRLGDRDKIEITPMKLQKLVYYSHGWHLGLTSKPLINEQVECWEFGPVVNSLFHHFKRFRSSPITERATRLKYVDGTASRFIPNIPDEATDAHEVIDAVWKAYKGYGPLKLSNMTHAEGEPWRTVFDSYDGHPPKGTDIPQEVIREYFKSKLKG